MLRQRTRTLQATMALTDALATMAGFYGGYYTAGPLLQRLGGMKVVLPVQDYHWVLLASVPMWWALFTLFNCYDFSPIERIRDSLIRLWRPLLTGVLAIAALTFFQKNPLFSRRVVAAIALANVTALALARWAILALAARRFRASGGLRRIVIVGSGAPAEAFAQAVHRAGWGLEIVGVMADQDEGGSGALPCLGEASQLPRVLDERNIDDVVIAGARDFETVQNVIRTCEEVGVAIHIPSDFFRVSLSRPHLEPFFGIPMLTFSTTPYGPVALGIKRALDLLLGAALLILTALPMLVFAIIIKCTSRGPVIFRQERGGLYGRSFIMYKFRSMVPDAEQLKTELQGQNEADGPAFKMRHDPRITPFGRFLRRYSLDELPQLWNVILGDMSLIGPRPPLPREVASYKRWQRRRLSMRPGLTCIWQVSNRTHGDFEKWMANDLHYIDHWSLWLDLKIALRTLPAVLRGTGV